MQMSEELEMLTQGQVLFFPKKFHGWGVWCWICGLYLAYLLVCRDNLKF